MATRWQQFKRFLAPRLDIPFSRDDANRFLPWFIALMVFLTGVFLAVGVTVGEILHHKRQDLSQWLTVQVPADTRNPALEASITAALEEVPQIESVHRRPQAEIEALLAPWFGDGEVLRQLALPIVLEAKLSGKDGLDLKALRDTLRGLAAGAEVDDHQYWLDHYLSFIRMLAWAAYGMAALIIAATTVMIIFTSKTALKLHKDAVWLLHSVGAVDLYIARQFQFNAFLLGMRGALIGTSLAAALFFCVGFFTAQFEAPLLPSLPISGWHVAIWLALPLLTGFLAMIVARKTVLAMLQKMT